MICNEQHLYMAGSIIEKEITAGGKQGYPSALPQRRFPEDFVFTHGNNHPYSADLLNKLFRTATKQLGIDITLYEATKHSFGTRYVNDGVSKDLLKEWFGHTKVEMTERYARVKVVDAFRQMLETKKKLKSIGSL